MKNMSDILKGRRVSARDRKLLRIFNLSPSGARKAASVKKLAETLGFEVEQVDLPPGVSGCLVQELFAENGYRIEVNQRQRVEARRWAVLHEIGHYFLHADHTDPFAFGMNLDRSGETFYTNPQEEREANEFAEVLLFGDNALEAALDLYGKNIENLRRHFGVSEKTLRIALRQFCPNR